ncbi:hypothetical protein QR665_21715 [Acinetobacter gerneri]|uniref:hypothetical protein n=1 Tax=Acinetobacter gerneri TaxID=202952 RepID=UPI00293675AA|nr:hypothetical protein [Acinetobacter gerneri]MDV2442021.1 hypothetical protein [Acinetobacter gerneri]
MIKKHLKENQIQQRKLIKGLIIRYGEIPFVLKAVFICRAVEQKWTKEEIDQVLNEACGDSYKHFISVLRSYSDKHHKNK